MSRTTISHLFSFLAGASLLLVGVQQDAFASVILPDLDDGDTYRIVFSTTNKQAAMSGDISTYDGYIRASLSDVLLALAPADQWEVIATTSAVYARDHTETQPFTDPPQFAGIFNTGGEIVATSYQDFWDSGLSNPINYDQDGNAHETQVWTGTNYTGTTDVGRYLGVRLPYFGHNSHSNGYWINAGVNSANNIKSFYGISPVLTYSDPSHVVPEPSSVVVFGGLALCFIVGCRRHRKFAKCVSTIDNQKRA
jgi:hypothetical protein